MERQALISQIQSVINTISQRIIKRNLNEYQRYMKELIDESEDNFIKIAKNWERQIKEIDKRIVNLLASNSNKSQLTSEINVLTKEINGLKVTRNKLEREAKKASDELSEMCSEIAESDAQNYLPSPGRIVKQLQTAGPIKVNLPVVGQIQTTIAEVDQLSLQRGLPNSKQLITDVLENFDLTPFKNQINELNKSCLEKTQLLLNQELRIQQVEQQYSIIQEKIISLIDKITEAGFRTEVPISELLTAIKSQFGVDIDIEKAEKEDISANVDEDLALAELVSLCDDPNPSVVKRVLQIGQNLGFDINQLNRFPPNEICRRILAEFSL